MDNYKLVKFISNQDPYRPHHQKKLEQSDGSIIYLDFSLSGFLIGIRVPTEEVHAHDIPEHTVELLEFSQEKLYPEYEQLILQIRQQDEKKSRPQMPPGFPFPPGFNPFGG